MRALSAAAMAAGLGMAFLGSAAPTRLNPANSDLAPVASLKVLKPNVELSSAPGSLISVGSDRPVHAGDKVRTGQDSSAVVSLKGGTVELAPLTEVEVGRDGIRVRTGSLLVSGALPMEIRGARITTSGWVRVDADLSSRVGAYEGSARVGHDGRTVNVSRYRQVSFSAGRFPRDTSPLRVSPLDPWDRRLLGDELELERTLRSYLLGLASRPDLVASALRRLGAGGSSIDPIDGLDGAPVSFSSEELVIAASIADASQAGLERVLRSRSEGASWAVIAAAMGAHADPVYSRFQEALNSSDLERSAASGSPVASGVRGGASAMQTASATEAAPALAESAGSGPAADPPAESTPAGEASEGSTSDRAPAGPGADCSDCGAVTALVCNTIGVCLHARL
jgi:hypothetical protein